MAGAATDVGDESRWRHIAEGVEQATLQRLVVELVAELFRIRRRNGVVSGSYRSSVMSTSER